MLTLNDLKQQRQLRAVFKTFIAQHLPTLILLMQNSQWFFSRPSHTSLPAKKLYLEMAMLVRTDGAMKSVT